MNVDSSQQWHVSLGVRNVDPEPFPGDGFFSGVAELHDSAGQEVSRVQVMGIGALGPDEAVWPAALQHKLAPGAYTLSWSASDHGGVVVDFTIVELDGWLYLGEEWVQSPGGETLPDEREDGALQSLIGLARVNLAQRLGLDPDAVTVQDIQETEFPDASLGVPEPGRIYAQVLTPGYTIKLHAGGGVYEYHASSERLPFAPQDEAPTQGSITITGVQVDAGKEIVVSGLSTLPDGTCLGTELWAGGELQSWWPGETCVPVADGLWQMVVPLGEGQAPAALDISLDYMLRAFQRNGPDVVSVFSFDMTGPPTPAP